MHRHHLPQAALFLLALSATIYTAVGAAEAVHPKYKPSARSPEAIDILSNAYGASRSAPNALGIGDTAPDFELPRAGGGQVSMVQRRANGPVAIVFYRGHW